MESLRYICWMVCLVQIVTVDGRPDFGTAFQFSVTPTISQLSAEISSVFASIDDELHFMMSASIPDGESKRQLMAAFAEDFSVKSRAITDQLAASSTSSMGTTLSVVFAAYEELSSFLNFNANNFLATTAQTFGLYLTVELFDGLVGLVLSMSELKTKIEFLQTSLASATVAEDVPLDRLRMVVRALRFMKAHIPLVVYTFQRVGVNLHMAETFFVTFKQNQQGLAEEFMREAVAFNAQLSAVEVSVGLALSAVEVTFTNVGTQLENELTGYVQSQTGFMQLQTSLVAFTGQRSMFVRELKESILLTSSAYRESVETFVAQTYYFDSSVTLDSPALDLVTLLIQSNVFDRMCYNKYAALVADLLVLGQIRLAECFDNELPRLRKLQHMIETYGLMVSYDGNDLWNNLKPCRSEFASNSCMTEVSAFYPRLSAARDTNMETSVDNFFTSALTGSLNRIDLCFTKVNFLTFQRLVPSFRGGITSCFNGLS
ncbi:uncharacterized protein LOC126561153 [Anopheles maculipalpis]|uniref:uncharacterized protein LOC126561153 n=1 Tax=Anopheles maculipalpis TaxID=1496333 RepID=UPI002158E25B|nr:uncharacterized protein LOC126561153 [Anopheles maculipalpis]